jgi:hypothetical protein
MNDGIDRERLLEFLGFGNPNADAVFIGMEEGLTIPPPLEEQLATRSRFSTFMDLGESAKAHPERFLSGERPPIQPTWNPIIRILLALEGNEQPTTDDIRFYQRDRLGRTTERGALLEFLPLPAKGLGEWPYDVIFPAFPTRTEYRAIVEPARVASLKKHLEYGPRLIVAYGAGYWSAYKQLFAPTVQWRPLDPFEIADIGATRVILTPHFTSRQMNGQREALIALALGREA